MVGFIEKMGLIFEMMKDPRLRMDVNALRYARDGYIFYAWELLKEVKLIPLLKYGSRVEEIMRARGIKNRKLLECILDLLVGEGVLSYKGGVYKYVKEPKEFEVKKLIFLEKFYPNSVRWTNTLVGKAKEVLLETSKFVN